MHVCIYVHTCACLYVCMHACTYVDMYVCACLCVCMHAFLHGYSKRLSAASDECIAESVKR